MPLVLADRVRETTTTTGTGTISLAGPVSGFQGFSTAIGNGNTTYYTIVDAATGAWEVGLGTYTSSGSTLARTTVLSSSNSDALVPFASGTKDVFVTQPAERAVYVLGAGTGLAAGAAAFTANGVPYASATNTLTTGSALTFDGSKLLVGSNTAGYGTLNVARDTTTPYASLTITDEANAANTVGLYLRQAGSSAAGISTAGAPLAFYLGGAGTSEQMRLTSTGLGIGTSSPSYKLHVVGTGGFANNGNENLFLVDTSGSTRSSLQISSSTNYFNANIDSASHGQYIWRSSNAYTERMRLDSSGNLGIGTSSPGAKLDISGADNTCQAIILRRGIKPTISNLQASILCEINGIGTAESLTFMADAGYKWLDDAGTTEWMRLNSSGNLGLGVTPSAWFSSYKAFQVNTNGSLTSNTDFFAVSNNAFVNTSGNDIYLTTGFAGRYRHVASNGAHQWFTAASGTAGNAITFTQAMTLDASGNLGLGATSVTALGSGYTTQAVQGTNGAGFRLYAGATEYGRMYADSGGAYLQSVGASTPLVFLRNAAESARIDSSGNFFLGKTSASTSTLGWSIYPTGLGDVVFTLTGTNEIFVWNNTATSGTARIDFRTGNVSKGKIQWDNSNTSYLTTSDYRLKENITPMTGALAKVAALNPVTYTWKTDGSDGQGFIAHELQAVCPDAVSGEKDAVNEDGSIKPQGIDTSFLVATLAAAIKELKSEFDAYKATHP